MKKPKSEIVSLKQLRQERGEPLTLTVTIPAKAVPLFLALVEVTQAESQESLAAFGLCKWITSEDAMQAFDNVVNGLL